MEISSWLSKGSSALKTNLFALGDTSVSGEKLVAAFLTILITYGISKLICRSVKMALKKKKHLSEDAAKMPAKITHWFIMLGGLVIALQIVGIDLSTLFAAGAVFSVGLGFAMQNIVQNFVSGIILFAEHTIKPGDIIEVEKEMVRVVAIGIRSTVARTREDDERIIPNSTLVQSSVTNYTMTDSAYTLQAKVGVSYNSDLKTVKNVLTRVGDSMPWRDKTAPTKVQLFEFGSSSLDFKIFVKTNDPWNSRRLHAELLEQTWWALKEAGITIAYPQLDLHLDTKTESMLLSSNT